MRGCRAGFLWASALAFLRTSRSEIVEVSTVSNVEVTATGWDLRAAADGGCGVAGCDPRLTRDGLDNTASDSRWSCEPDLISSYDGCEIVFTFDESFTFDHVVLYVHESNTAQVSIPFEVVLDSSWSDDRVSGLTTPGTPLGEGEQTNVPDTATSTRKITLEFTLTSGQYIGLSEVEFFVDVENVDDYVITPVDELYVVKATNVTNVMPSATYWNLDADAGCGDAGCTPSLVTDGQDNTNSTSRWSCQVEDDYDADNEFAGHRCQLLLTMDASFTISYVMVYVHESDDPDKEAMVLELGTGSSVDGTYQTTPGTPLGTGERFNLPRSLGSVLYFDFVNVTAGQVIAISEVEIYLEVTDTNVPIPAKEAWTDVTAETLTTVATLATGSLNDTSPEATRDGDDNTVATSRWSCDGGELGYCALVFDFNDEYTVSYLNLYMDGSDDAAQEPVELEFCSCETETYQYYGSGLSCNCVEGYSDPVGTYVTQPGTPLGEPERVNLLNPLTSSIGIVCRNLTAAGGTVSIGEVEIFFQVPDATPTPAPFIDETSSYSGSTTGYSPSEATTSFFPEVTTSPTSGTVTTSLSPEATSSSSLSETPTTFPAETTTTSSTVETTSSSPPLESTTTSLEGEENEGDATSGGSDYSAGDDDTPAGSIPSATPTPADGTNELDLLGSGGFRITKDRLWVAVTLGVAMLMLPIAF